MRIGFRLYVSQVWGEVLVQDGERYVEGRIGNLLFQVVLSESATQEYADIDDVDVLRALLFTVRSATEQQKIVVS